MVIALAIRIVVTAIFFGVIWYAVDVTVLWATVRAANPWGLLLAILLIFKMLGAIVARVVRKALSSSKLNVSDLLNEFAVGMTRKIVFVLGVLVALSVAGAAVSPAAAAAIRWAIGVRLFSDWRWT